MRHGAMAYTTTNIEDSTSRLVGYTHTHIYINIIIHMYIYTHIHTYLHTHCVGNSAPPCVEKHIGPNQIKFPLLTSME